ncbi:competence protein ComFC [Edaphobacillus lindanitolerans]|uniref:Competence protein ComFC n=1 Tax=Edaphobacillus lindanitolerans TaxID=550447 RepID=A0A1U7PM52_9BACI|nr:competence protein ComFC [Edaphobacillus lindanitolerans]
MNCLLCNGRTDRNPSWARLFSDKGFPVVCEGCRKGFLPAESQPPLSDWDGTPYAGMLERAVSLFAYNEPMKEFLHQYKFLKDVALSRVFKSELAEAIRLSGGQAVPIPMHPDRLNERTFAHVEEMLRAARVPYADLLEKTAPVTLGRMNRQERIQADRLFRLRSGIRDVRGEYVLVDDLYTTGTTVHHAAAVLRQAGADKVSAVTLIRA